MSDDDIDWLAVTDAAHAERRAEDAAAARRLDGEYGCKMSGMLKLVLRDAAALRDRVVALLLLAGVTLQPTAEDAAARTLHSAFNDSVGAFITLMYLRDERPRNKRLLGCAGYSGRARLLIDRVIVDTSAVGEAVVVFRGIEVPGHPCVIDTAHDQRALFFAVRYRGAASQRHHVTRLITRESAYKTVTASGEDGVLSTDVSIEFTKFTAATAK